MQYAFKLFALQARVEDDGHRADLLGREIAERNGGRIGQQQTDPMTLANALMLQVAGERPDALVERGESEFFLFGDDRGFVRLERGGSRQNFGRVKSY